MQEICYRTGEIPVLWPNWRFLEDPGLEVSKYQRENRNIQHAACLERAATYAYFIKKAAQNRQLIVYIY